MDTTRHVVALLLIVLYPPVLSYWLLIHPLVRVWRRVGLALTYAVVSPVMAGIGAGMFSFRQELLSLDLGTNYWLLLPAVPVLLMGLVLDVACRRQLQVRVLVGLPELAPDRSGNKLLTTGIYARLRHPRYVAGLLGLLGVSFFTNFVATYALFALCVPVILLITHLEERELHARFGPPYERYCQDVPRFLPRRAPR